MMYPGLASWAKFSRPFGTEFGNGVLARALKVVVLRWAAFAGDDEMKILLILLTLIAAQASAQQIGQNTPANASGTYTLTAKSQLVVETVVVKDKQGKFIPGLRRQGLHRYRRRHSADNPLLRAPGSRRRAGAGAGRSARHGTDQTLQAAHPDPDRARSAGKQPL